MGWNDAYWNNKEENIKKAVEHHAMMVKQLEKETKFSIENTEVWDDIAVADSYLNIKHYGSTKSIVVNVDTVTGLFKYHYGKTVVLNFASYKVPGGGYMNGSGAQEESLCHASNLYEVLSSPVLEEYYSWNNEHKNNSLYRNRALWSPNIVFIQNDKIVKADVLTIAAPNNKAYMDYIPDASPAENLSVLKNRIQFVCNIIMIHGCNTAILGAFGCGVFGQDPKIVAELFKAHLEDSGLNAVYAVIDKGGHSKNGAYAEFKKVFEEVVK